MPPSSPSTPRPFSFSPGAANAPTSPSPLRKGASPRSRGGSPTPVTLASFGAPALGNSPSGSGGSSGPQASQATTPKQDVLLPRHKEVTFHRTLRTLLLDHRKWREQWEEMHTLDGLKAVSAFSQADEEVARLIPSIDTSRNGLDLALVRAKEHHLAIALADREAALDTLAEILTTLHTFVERLRKIDARARQLLLDASFQQGFEFAFYDGMWGSWTMDAFVRFLASLTTQYAVSTADLQSALDQLTPKRHVDDPTPGIALAQTLSTAAALSSALESAPSADQASTPSPQAAEKHRKRLNEAWALLPYLIKTGPASEKFFEKVCEVDVGQWE